MTRKVTILGATGSIGQQALDVARAHPEELQVVAMSAHTRIEQLIPLVQEFRPRFVAVHTVEQARVVRAQCPFVEVGFGEEALQDAASLTESSMLLNALVGAAGIRSTLAALQAGIDVALANKETLVAAGDLVLDAARVAKVKILPVDSEHSAITQCLQDAHSPTDVEKLLLTASGGPFRTASKADLLRVTVQDALAHPTWTMGAKISIDSATLMNKGLEVIEAHFLFDVPYSDIEILIHPQSIIHSMVQFRDGAVLAQLGSPDMRIPIQYALLGDQGRLAANWKRLNWSEVSQLTFELPDIEKFPAISLAYECGIAQKTYPAVMNAANETAVYAFLAGHIHFLEIVEIVRRVVEAHQAEVGMGLDEIFAADRWARETAQSLIAKRGL
ncbi:1-deoxy-D-xylulose-5-phosphate reductoisomerase [Sulfoacidibacillus thermotolerans]|uniref:1-deoxy-D-xylulose 5-phosphate reductoisomerase n=1 Tax=Sulfoacidibacillus thermotolerans TaxID=1765684 RepID=A0A2U3DAA3_SULT2|nr:1-deoxy-D-xylulose-5-phosphate reductoisomerase [Sulfoacidibacillus thermotolerans]PWI58214.1 1-deoxy-D-xylulose-5-phosphate reductoisomerase [Sulfoacidibacillus thermotolerans]